MSVKNLCIFSGRVGQDPEMRYLPDGTAMATFGLASRRSWKNKQTDEWEEETTWVDCVAFSNTAERIVKRLQQGTQVTIQTEYTKRKAQTDSGEERTYHNFKIFDFEVGVKGRDSSGDTVEGGEEQYAAVSEPEDIPF